MPRTTDRPPASSPTARGWAESFVPSRDGTRIYVRTRVNVSAAVPCTLILCDGIACDGFVWRYLPTDLEGTARIAHWNYRGHGRSSAPPKTGVDVEHLVDDLEAVRAVVPGPHVLVGHSLGCQVALEGYRRNPTNIAGMVLICGAAGHVTSSFKGSDALAIALPQIIERVERHPMISKALWSNVPPDVATRLALKMGEVDAQTIDAEDLVRYMEHAANLDVLMFLRMLRSVGESTAEDMLESIKVPTLVVAGDKDSFTPPGLAKAMADQITDSELWMVRGGTHVVPLERRDETRDKILAFLHRRVRSFLDGKVPSMDQAVDRG